MGRREPSAVDCLRRQALRCVSHRHHGSAVPDRSRSGTLDAMNVPESRVFATRVDDAVAGLCGGWMMVGLFVDGWAHRNQKPETFFTPWHGLLYSGFMASAVWMLMVVRRHHGPGLSIRRTIPVGYGFRSVGVGVFGVGAILDLLWHQVFGVEANIEALLSPTHLVLLSSGLLMAVGPIVSTLAREGRNQKPTWASTGPIVGTVAFVTALLQFFFMYLSPYDRGIYERFDGEVVRGIGAIVVFTMITTVALLFVIRRIVVPRGSFVVLLFVPALAQTVLTSFNTAPRLVGPAFAALAAELTWGRVARSSAAARRYVIPAWVAALTLVTWFGLFIGVELSDGIGWSVHLWTGAPVLAALLAGLTAASTACD
jgi:hypothetical protein